MALGVALGAFGAHVLDGRLAPGLVRAYRTGVEYHLVHGLGLLAVGAMALRVPASRPLAWAGALMAAGIVLFSGSLYLLALTGARWLGAVTPFGGVAFIAAWVTLAYAALRARGDRNQDTSCEAHPVGGRAPTGQNPRGETGPTSSHSR
ncbi:MAG: DUF423 domain-containing protein [Burkholderiales bacterium]|nr:DUF423 domain-containing protein [Burkholderiales bacterium]